MPDGVLRTAADIERGGIATAEQIGIETLADRLRATSAQRGPLSSPSSRGPFPLELMIAGPEGGPSSDMQRYEG